MSDQDIRDSTGTATAGDDSLIARWPFWLWATTTVAFLAYLVFGSVEIRLWRFGRLGFEDRRIAHVWAYFGERLPELSGNGLMAALYWLSLATIVLGTIAGLWVILVDRPEPAPRKSSATTAGHGA